MHSNTHLHSFWKQSSGECRFLLGVLSPDEVSADLPNWRSQIPETGVGGEETVSVFPFFQPQCFVSDNPVRRTCLMRGTGRRPGEGVEEDVLTVPTVRVCY